MAKLYTKKIACGQSQPLINIINDPVPANRAPTNEDRYEIGQTWINKLTNQVWMLTSYAAGVPVWTELDDAGDVGIAWSTDATGAVALAQNHGYYLTNVGAINCTLPAVAGLGSEIWLITQNSTAGAAGINLLQNAAQYIRADAHTSTPGIGGRMSWIGLGDGATPFQLAFHIICTIADTEFSVVSTFRAPSNIV